MTLSLRRIVRRRRAIGAVAAAGAVLFASFGLDASLADASADAIDTAAAVEGSANADHADGRSDTAGEVANDPGAGGTTSTSAPATTTTVESLGGASATTSTTAATTTTVAAGATTTSTPASTSTSTVTTTTRPTTTSTTVDELGVASVTTVPLSGGTLGGVLIDGDINGLAPPASLAVSTTIRSTTPSTVATQRGAPANESATKQVLSGATDATAPLATAPVTTAAPATTTPGPTLPPLPTTEAPRPTAVTPASRPSYEVERAATVLIKGVEPVPSGARSSDGTMITLQFPWDSSQRIGVQLHASRLPSLWTVWVVIALLLMAFWLPGPKRQHAVARRSAR